MPTQTSLPFFLETPSPSPEIWEPLDNSQRAALLDKLAQLIAKSAVAQTQPEDPSHE